MNKTLIAAVLTAMTSSALAQNVEVYGKMRIYQGSDKVGAGDQVSQQFNDASRLGFRGVEDLGDGLKAFFVLETAVSADDPSGSADSKLGDRQSVVGLRNSLISASLGRDKHTLGHFYDRYDPLDNAVFGTSIGTIHASQGTRMSNGVYLQVTPTKAVQFNLQRSSSEVNGTKSAVAGGVDVTFGGLQASVSRYDNGTTSTSDAVGARYNLASTDTTLFAVYSDNEVVGATHTGKTVGAKQKLSKALTASVSYGERSTGIKATNLGMHYALSKRTAVVARYRNDDAAAAASDRRQWGIGIDHNF